MMIPKFFYHDPVVFVACMNGNMELMVAGTGMVLEARGRLGDCVFYVWKGTPCVRRHVRPVNPRTKRQEYRARFAALVRRRQAVNMSGYNLFIGVNVKLPIQLFFVLI
ncbi:MAG: hypothetical protein E4G96_00755 [Chrysiogenales bacterium]|nr:MAG: hypothetical protein E4G96_00755 [Chrysiogenales bacterium]